MAMQLTRRGDMRRKDRQLTYIDDIKEILTRGRIAHIAFFDDKYPYVIPMSYGFEMENGRIFFYFHSAMEGHKLDLIGKNRSVCIEIECNVEMTEGETACAYGYKYMSFVGFGNAEILSGDDEKADALKLFMKCQTGRDFDISKEMVGNVVIIRVGIDEYEAKGRRH
ncbi:MAG TPA: MFS transporter [Spirochaetaceae bacterium]|nr:MFS transporter [Spirochaetaceae bacterium]